MTDNISFLQRTNSTADLTTYTFSSVNFGAAAGDRHIIIACYARGSTGNRTLVSATIGGVAAAIHVQSQNNNMSVAIISAVVPTGASGDVVLTWSGACLNSAIATYRAVGVADAAAFDTDADTSAPLAVAVSVPSGGFVVAAVSALIDTEQGRAGVSSDHSGTFESTTARFWGGHAEDLAADATYDVTADAGTGTAALVAASWGVVGGGAWWQFA